MPNLRISLPDHVLDRLVVLASEREVTVSRFVAEILSNVAADLERNLQAEHQALFNEIKPRRRLADWNRNEIYGDLLGKDAVIES